MSAPGPAAERTRSRGPVALYVGLLVAALLLAGVVSYAADSDPDGLDSVTLAGCTVVEVDGEEQLLGDCIAQRADEHATSGSPLADYTVGGDASFTGIAGVLGVLATLLVAGGLFWGLRGRSGGTARRGGRSTGSSSPPRVE